MSGSATFAWGCVGGAGYLTFLWLPQIVSWRRRTAFTLERLAAVALIWVLYIAVAGAMTRAVMDDVEAVRPAVPLFIGVGWTAILLEAARTSLRMPSRFDADRRHPPARSDATKRASAVWRATKKRLGFARRIFAWWTASRVQTAAIVASVVVALLTYLKGGG